MIIKNTGDRPAEFAPVDGDWEAIPTTNESYGYSKFDDSHKPVGFFIQLLAKAASRGGNLLMNIGPMGNGAFDTKDIDILQGIGKWIGPNKESIYKTKASSLPLQSWGVTTLKDNRLYLHVFNWPADGKLVVGGIKSKIIKAYLLTDATKKNIPVANVNANDITLKLPAVASDKVNTVIVLELKEKLVSDSVRVVADNVPTRLLAFDGDLHGKGFNFGDGKSSAYYTEGWKSKDQYVSWGFRTLTPATYKVVVKYVASAESEGAYRISAGNTNLDGKITATAKGNNIETKELGTITFEKGMHEIKINALEISKAELMKLLEIQLIPVDHKN